MMLLLLMNRQVLVLIALMLQSCQLGRSGRVGHLPYDLERHKDNGHERTMKAVDVVLCI